MSKKTLTILTLIFQISAFGQVIVRQDNYSDFKIGIYQTKSMDPDIIGVKPLVIEPQTKFFDGERTAFLKVENNVIALFDEIYVSGTSKPVGVLTKTSIIQVDTIFYREIYNDTTKEWLLTFNVWYAITINGQQYYTDYKVHDFIAYKMKLDKYSQELLLISQSTGYDEFYDNGYPNYFFVAVLNNRNELIYESKILDFDYGDEFWEPEFVIASMTEKGFEFTISGLEKKCNAIWSGKNLINSKLGR